MGTLLKYSKPAANFREALPLGNGTLGAMIYGGLQRERISLNHDTLWSGRPGIHLQLGAFEAYSKAKEALFAGDRTKAEEALGEGYFSQWSQAYMPMGNLWIETEDEDSADYRRTLELSTAVASVHCGSSEREYFVSHPDQCLVVRYKGQKQNYRLFLDSLLHHKISLQGSTLILQGTCPADVDPHPPEGKENVTYGEGGMPFACAIRLVTDGKVLAEADALRVENASELTVLLSAETGFVSFDQQPQKECLKPVLDRLSAAEQKSYEQLKADHLADYSTYFDRVTFSLNSTPSDLDTDLRLAAEEKDLGLYELLFHFGRYLTISASRPGSQAMNLQGIWNEEQVPPWQSNYTVNINTEMNYWPTLPCNLPEFNEPLLELVQMIRKTGKAIADHYYHAPGFVAHHNVDLWGLTNPVGITAPGAAIRYACWPMASGWLCRHLAEHYEYTLDQAFLRDTVFPTLEEAVQFYLAVLVTDEKGYYILPMTSSPENTFLDENGNRHAVVASAAMTQSILRELFTNYLKYAKILGIENGHTTAVFGVLPKLKGLQIGSDGRLMEWDREYSEFDPKHRHISHLYGLYPGEEIDPQATPELAEACRKSLQGRGDSGTGWGLAWKVNFRARLKEGDHALLLMDRQLRLANETVINYATQGGTYPNLFCAHPPFQIDGNFGVTAGIVELLLQCRNGRIELLPALPEKWQSGQVTGLLAKGNVTVDLRWEQGKLQEAAFTSPIAQTLQLKLPDQKELRALPLMANQKAILFL